VQDLPEAIIYLNIFKIIVTDTTSGAGLQPSAGVLRH